MKQFAGFPARMQFTPLPNLFFSDLLPQMSNMAELKITLYIFAGLYRQRGHPRFVTRRQLLADTSLMSSLKEEAGPPEEVLRQALDMAARRGTLLHLVLDRDGAAEDVYFLNTEDNRRLVDSIRSGEYQLPEMKAPPSAPAEVEEMPDIFTIYEQNIGMLTPMIAEELREAEGLYPAEWIRDAIREAVTLNKRSWRYIAKILENWLAEGRSRGAYQRDSKKKAGPDKYFKGKYGRLLRG